jgi:hypothetical protein
MSRWFLLFLQIGEPFQLAYQGGSSMAWVRFIGESNHRMGHAMLRLGADPEASLMGCKRSQVREWIKLWGPGR